MNKTTATILSVTVIAIATIGGTIWLTLADKDPGVIIQLITVGVSLAAGTGVLTYRQGKTDEQVKAIARSVNGNTTTLIHAVATAGALTPEQMEPIREQNNALQASIPKE